MEASKNLYYERHVRDFDKRMLKIVIRDHLNEDCVKFQAGQGFFTERVCCNF